MKKYLLLIISMVCAVTGAWAGADVSINTNDETDPAKWEGTDALGWGCPKSVTVIGAINQTGLDYIQTRCASTGDYAKGKIPLTLSGATLDGDVSSFGEGFGKVILPANCDASKYSYGSALQYAISQGTPTYIYAASGTTLSSITELTTPLSGSFIVSGPGKSALETEITNNGGTLAFDGYATVAAGNVVSDIAALKTAQSIGETDITNLTITAGNLTSEETTYIKETLTNVGFLDISAATVSANDIYELLACGHITSITLSDAQKTALKSVSGKTFTADLLSKAGMTVDDLVTGMTTANYIVDGTTLIVTGNIDSTVDTQIASVLSTYNTVTTLDVSKATNTTNYEIAAKTGITLVKLSGSGKVTYAGNATVLTNGSLAIAIGSEYASVSDALTALSTTLSSSDVQHVKVTGALSTADLGNIHSLGSNVETIDLSEATLANGAAWTDLTGDFSNAGVLLPTGATPGTTTNANIFIINGNFLTATKNVAETFDAELAFFSETTGKTLLTPSGTTAIISGVLDNTALANISSLTEYTRIDLSGATIATGASIDNLQIPSALEQLVLPKDQTVSSTLATTLAAANNLWYAYSPSSDCSATGPNQTGSYDGTKNTIADYVWVVKADGLAKAFTNEEQLRNSFYIKVASSVALSNTDVDFNGLDAKKPTNYLFLDFSESNLTPSVAANYTVTDDIGYRIILPDGWTGDQMAVFAANPHCGNLAAVYSYNGTKLNIMEITDGSYSPAALANPRIVRAGTTEVNVISGTYNGETYAKFGDRLLAALNNMGKSEFDYNSSHYYNTVGLTVTKVSISTGSNVPNAITFDNPTIQTLELKNVGQGWSSLNVDDCSSLQTLNLNHINLGNVSAKVPAASPKTGLTSINLSGATINGSADFSTSPLTSAFTMDGDTYITSNLLLMSTGLTSFTPHGTIGGDIYLNASNNLESLDVRQFTQAANKKIHIDADANESDSNTDVIDKLEVANAVTVPSVYVIADHFHPVIADTYVKREAYVPEMVTTSPTTMMLHEKNAGSDGDNYIYWYDDQDPNHQGTNVTIGTSTETDQSLAKILTSKASTLNFGTTTYRRAKIEGPIASTDVDDLASINCQVLDLSSATFDEDAWAALKTAFKTSGTNIHSNVRFVILPDNSTREDIINGTALAGLTHVLSVIALNKITGATDESDNGTNLTSWNRISGALQAAVVAAGNHSCQSWTKTPDGKTSRNIYTSDISDFRECKISGLINSHDLSKGNQNLDANGHLSWDLEPVELSSGTDPRKLNGACTAYGPFSASFNLSVIDLQGAFFEEKGTNQGLEEKDKRYYFQDMTLSALGIISEGTYKVVVPTDPRAKEIPADFMNCPTKIRAICIPSNIVAIRTRAFYTIDYVWTTATNLTGTVDPEGSNTKLDNGAKLKIKDGTTYIETSALIYDNGAYKENPAFTKKCYVADYSTINGGGTYTFGSNLRLIETAAFANAQPHVKDVYVLNTKAPECHVDAFNTVMYTGNGGYSSISGDQKIISRENYFNNGFWITMLHYPRQTTTPELQRYTDPTREYSIATGERDGKGATLYFPNQSEFIRAYQQGTFGYTWNAWNPTRVYGSVVNGDDFNGSTNGWTAELQTAANDLFDKYATGVNHEYTSFYKVSGFTGETVTAPKATITPYYNVYWSDAAYKYSSSAAEGYSKLYPQSEIDSDTDSDTSGEKTSKDYRGWHQFVLNAYAANTVLKEEPYRSYITDDDWWTVCLPFSLTRAEAIQIFGTPEAVGDNQLPYVSRLLYVIRNLNTANISLCFSKNLMKNSERLGSANNKQHGDLDATGVVTIAKDTDPDAIPDDDDIVMAAGVPYLIKPNIPMSGNSAVNRQFRIYKTEDYGKLTTDQKNAISPKAICNDDLYERIKASQELSGADQISLVESGICKVPVFMTMTKDDRVSDESHETGSPDDPTYFINSTYYYKSTAWYYAFVGSFYKSFMPQYAYYLGWNGKAQFFYKTSAKENVMTWTNETGVIIPTKGSEFSAKVTPAAGMNPAQWLFFDNNNASTLFNDAFKINNGSSAKNYDMLFDAENVNVITGVDMPEVIAEDMLLKGNDALYNINGQKVNGSSHLPKGIYIQNGKKHVVK